MSRTAQSTIDDSVVITDLAITISTEDGEVRAVRGVDLAIRAGESVAVVGESGSGKSTMARAIVGLVDPRVHRISGSVMFRGHDMVSAPEKVKRTLRGAGIGIVFQDSTGALDPVFTIASQLVEVLQVDGELTRAEANARAIELLDEVGIADPARGAHSYPHQFSGGMRQRVGIALGIARRPALLIADEPTTALDATSQAAILELMARLLAEKRMGLLFITHDLNVARTVADRLVVMYAGEIAEDGPLDDVFEHPAHPYTLGLLQCHPSLGTRGQRLKPIPGSPPRASETLPGCSFAPRCPFATELCRTVAPPAVEVAPGHRARCHYAREIQEKADV